MFGMLCGWCCSWARLAEGIVGILSLGWFTPHWGLAVVQYFNKLRIRKLWKGGTSITLES